MKDLIEALNIFLKYGDTNYPFHCEHDKLYVYVVQPELVSKEDRDRLEQLGFLCGASDEDETELEDHFYSFRYGSC